MISGIQIVGDARRLPFPDESFNGACVSPSYGNRMADSHVAKDGSYRRTYSHSAKHPAPYSSEILPVMESLLLEYGAEGLLIDSMAGIGRIHQMKSFNTVGVEIEPEWAFGGERDTSKPLRPGNSGAMQWGAIYRQLHILAWREVWRVLKSDGLFLLNIKDHVRSGRRQYVTYWHTQTLIDMGFRCLTIRTVSTPGFRFGENRDARYPEQLLLFRKGTH